MSYLIEGNLNDGAVSQTEFDDLEDRVDSIVLQSSVFNLKEAGLQEGDSDANMSEATGIANQVLMQGFLNRISRNSQVSPTTPIKTIMYLPGGPWPIAGTGTLITDSTNGEIYALMTTPPAKRGFTMTGVGVGRNSMAEYSAPFSNPSKFAGMWSAFVYVGPTNPTNETVMFCVDSMKSVKISNLCLFGRPLGTDTAFSKVSGLAVAKSTDGIGSGEHYFESIYYCQLDRGMVFGVPVPAVGGDLNTENNDTCLIEHCLFDQCRVGAQHNGLMVMGNQFINTNFFSVSDYCLEYTGGGTLTFNHGFIDSHSANAFIKLSPSGVAGDENGGFGDANMTYVVTDLIMHGIEGGATHTKMFDMSAFAPITGTADSGTTTTLVDTERTEPHERDLLGRSLTFNSGSNSGQTRTISAFVPSTDTMTFSVALGNAVATGDTYTIAGVSGPSVEATFDKLICKPTDYFSGGYVGFDMYGNCTLFIDHSHGVPMIRARSRTGADRPVISVTNSHLLRIGHDGLMTTDSTDYATGPKYYIDGDHNRASIGATHIRYPRLGRQTMIAVEPYSTTTTVAVANGLGTYVVPQELHGYKINKCIPTVFVLGAGSGNTTAMMRRDRGGSEVDVFTANTSIAFDSYGTSTTIPISGTNGELQVGDILTVDVSAVASTPPTGLKFLVELVKL